MSLEIEYNLERCQERSIRDHGRERECDDDDENVVDWQKKKMRERSRQEWKKMWEIAGPAILASVSEFSIGFVTSAFVGHLGDLELAAVSLVQNVIEGFVYGFMLGMGSALETLSGQAVGAGRFNMLGIYLQRSFIVTGCTALCLTPVYVFASPLLKLFRLNNEMSELAGKYSVMIIPQLFAYAINFPIQKFLQSQNKVWVLTMISMSALAFHALLNWILITKLNQGLVGAAIAGNVSWWLLVSAQIIYVTSGWFPAAWTGFSSLAIKSLASFVKLSLASAVMLCLELWNYTAIILMVGWLTNPKIAVDAISISMNLQLWTLMIALGFNVSISVRVSNELGAGNPEAAKFSIVVAVLTSAGIGVLFTAVALATKNQLPKMFTQQPEVIKATSKLGYFLATTILLNSIQPVLHGVAVGVGWQFKVALINITSYYIIGLPISALLGYKFKLGVQGIWFGLLIGCLIQTIVLLVLMLRTNWHKEALQAEDRVRALGGDTGTTQL